jgi:hypothetical protein
MMHEAGRGNRKPIKAVRRSARRVFSGRVRRMLLVHKKSGTLKNLSSSNRDSEGNFPEVPE